MLRAFILPLFASFLAFYAFLRTSGAEHVRAVQMLALIAVGMGMGVALAHIKLIINTRSRG
jgi:hypothetical protein